MAEIPETRSLRAVGGQSTTCAQCESSAVDTTVQRHTFPYGVDESAVDLTVDLPVRRCTACGFEFLDQESEEVKLEAICKHLDILSPMGIRRIRKLYRMTQAEFAEVTGLGTATLARWENGSMNHTRAYDRYVRLLANPDVMARLRRLAQPTQPLREHARVVRGSWRVIRPDDALKAKQRSFHPRRAGHGVAA